MIAPMLAISALRQMPRCAEQCEMKASTKPQISVVKKVFACRLFMNLWQRPTAIPAMPAIIESIRVPLKKKPKPKPMRKYPRKVKNQLYRRMDAVVAFSISHASSSSGVFAQISRESALYFSMPSSSVSQEWIRRTMVWYCPSGLLQVALMLLGITLASASVP